MNIYVIYKFADYEVVNETINNIRNVISGDNSIFMFNPTCTSKTWKLHATQKLKNSQLVVLFDSLSDQDNVLGKHISWELQKAEKFKKRIVVFKTDLKSNDRSWYEYDYSEQDPRHSRYETVGIENAVDFMKKEYGWEVNDTLLHVAENKQSFSDADKLLLLEQYRIMIETSEKLMERRQEMVNLYTTLCTTLIAFIGASFAFSDFSICSVIMLISGLMLLILCRNWRISLNSYDMNNYGKFKVINAIERILPAEMFECEYRYNKRNGIRSFSSREKVLPRIFSTLGIILILFGALTLLLQFLEKSNIISNIM